MGHIADSQIQNSFGNGKRPVEGSFQSGCKNVDKFLVDTDDGQIGYPLQPRQVLLIPVVKRFSACQQNDPFCVSTRLDDPV